MIFFQIIAITWLLTSNAFATDCCEHNETAPVELTANTNDMHQTQDSDPNNNCGREKEKCNDQDCCPNIPLLVIHKANYNLPFIKFVYEVEYIFNLPDLVMPVLVRPPIV